MRPYILVFLILNAFINACFAKSNEIELCSEVFEYKGEAYFCAEHAELGKELFRSNGTPAGTNVVIDIDVGKPSSTPSSFFELKGYLYFVAENPQYGRALWRTDGTKKNTKKIKSLPAYSGFSNNAKTIKRVGNEVFIQLDGSGGSSINNAVLWKTDGTSAGTKKLNATVTTGAHLGTSFYWPKTSYFFKGDYLFYVTANKLYKLNLITNKESFIKKFRSDTNDFENERFYNAYILENEEADVSDVFYISNNNDGRKFQDSGLWQSDGTLLGTKRKHAGTHLLTKVGHSLVICEKEQLYVLSRTNKSIVPDVKLSDHCGTYVYAKFGKKVYITDYDGSGNNVLYLLDLDTGLATIIARNVRRLSGSNDSVAGQKVILAGDDYKRIYSIDGITGQKTVIKEFSDTQVSHFFLSPNHSDFYFDVIKEDDVNSGRELWWSNGTSEKVRKIKNIPNYIDARWREGHRLYFEVEVSRYKSLLWHSDATTKGTYKLTYFTQDDETGKSNKGLIIPAIQLLLDDDKERN